MNKNSNAQQTPGESPAVFPIRCSLCGASFLNLYLSSSQGMINATCCNGHKTSYPAGQIPRKAG